MHRADHVNVAFSGAIDSSCIQLELLGGFPATTGLHFTTIRQAASEAARGCRFDLLVVAASELADVPRAVAALLSAPLEGRSIVVTAPASKAQWMTAALLCSTRSLDILGPKPSSAEWRVLLETARAQQVSLTSICAGELARSVAVDDVRQSVALQMAWWGVAHGREGRVAHVHRWLRRPARLHLLGRVARTVDALVADLPRSDECATQLRWRSLRQMNEWLRRALGTSDHRALARREIALDLIRRTVTSGRLVRESPGRPSFESTAAR